MIRTDQYELIRTAHRVYGKSIRQIAREYGHSRKVIRKVLLRLMPGYRLPLKNLPSHPLHGGTPWNVVLHLNYLQNSHKPLFFLR